MLEQGDQSPLTLGSNILRSLRATQNFCARPVRFTGSCSTEYVPHDWLYLRVKVAVHHGGAGTTSASLHAGIAAITMPLGIDQFFWGERIYKIGVGPKPIPQRALNAEKLANAIQESLENNITAQCQTT